VRRRHIRYVAYNSRFLILPWLRVAHLASHLLSRMTARLSRDWGAGLCHPICLTETFVDTDQTHLIHRSAAALAASRSVTLVCPGSSDRFMIYSVLRNAINACLSPDFKLSPN
jgi:hypothetical protein